MSSKNFISTLLWTSMAYSNVFAQQGVNELGSKLAICSGKFGAIAAAYINLGQIETANGYTEMFLLSASLSKKYISPQQVDTLAATELKRVGSMFSQNAYGGAKAALDESNQCLKLLQQIKNIK